jgi:hypothetical protein
MTAGIFLERLVVRDESLATSIVAYAGWASLYGTKMHWTQGCGVKQKSPRI